MKTKSKKTALLMSFTSLLICFAMLAGSTFAWFTDTATTGVNQIKSGTLDVELWDDTEDKKLSEEPLKWRKAQGHENEEVLWEPGCSYNLEGFRIKNNGNLALKYKIQITGIVGDNELKDAIDFTYQIGTAALNLNKEGHLKAGEISDVISINGKMKESAGNEYQNKSIDGIAITVYATQDTVENDSFDNQYDKYATYAPSNRRYVVTSHEEAKSAFAAGGSISFDHYFEGDETKTKASDRLVIQYPSVIELNEAIHVPGSLEDSANWAEFFINADTTINASSGGGIFCSDKVGETNPDYIGGPYVAHVNGENIVVTVNGGFYHGGGTVFNVEKGTLIVNGGSFQVTPDIDTNDYRYTLNCIDANYKNGSANIIVKGGTFVNFDPSNNLAEGENTNFVAPGYKVISETQSNGDIWYTVVAK